MACSTAHPGILKQVAVGPVPVVAFGLERCRPGGGPWKLSEESDALRGFFLAMAHYRLGQHDEAATRPPSSFMTRHCGIMVRAEDATPRRKRYNVAPRRTWEERRCPRS